MTSLYNRNKDTTIKVYIHFEIVKTYSKLLKGGICIYAQKELAK